MAQGYLSLVGGDPTTMARPTLKDLIAEPAELKLRQFPAPLALRPMTVADELHMERTHGVDWMNLLARGDLVTSLGLAWQLLTPASRELFVKQEVTFIDDSGDKHTRQVGGLELLMFAIEGKAEQHSLSQALTKAMGFEKLTTDPAFEGAEATASAPAAGLTGPASSTPSGSGTDGEPKTSSG